MVTTPLTRAAWVDARLRRAIITGELPPGTRLRGEHLAAAWGVSATPLRESFQRLAGEGLVVVEPQRGARVAPLDHRDALEIYELRLLLDPVAVRSSVEAAHRAEGGVAPAYLARLGDTHDRLTGRFATLVEFHDAHRDFHLALVAACPNDRLRAEVGRLLEQSQRYQVIGGDAARRADAAHEHERLFAAACAGDATAAARVMTAHLRGTLDAIAARA